MHKNNILILSLVLLSSLIFITQSCKKKKEEPVPLLGQSSRGGIIFYIDATGEHGLVSATADLGTGSEWGCYGTTINGADNTSVGSGDQNTTDISRDCTDLSTAARLCYDYASGGFSDWYLPSKDELDIMYKNKDKIGGFRLESYWSSSEVNATRAWIQSFNSGAQFATTNKDYGTNVRPIRSF